MLQKAVLPLSKAVIGLWYMTGKENIEAYFTQFVAGSVCIAIQIIIFFIWLQKYYVSDIASDSVK